jgi:hypothetical protein
LTLNEGFNYGDRKQLEIIKKFSGEKRVLLGAELYEIVRQLIMDGFRNRHPGLDEWDIRKKTKEIIAPWSRKTH